MTALQEAPVRRRRGPESAIHDSHAPLIRRLYWEDGRTIAWIAGLYGFSPAGMRKWMAVHGIPRRPRTGHAGGVASTKYLLEYNAERTQRAAPAQIARVRAALDRARQPGAPRGCRSRAAADRLPRRQPDRTGCPRWSDEGCHRGPPAEEC